MRIVAACVAAFIACSAALASSYDDFARGLATLQQHLPDEAVRLFGAAIAAGDLNSSLLPQAYRGRAQANLLNLQCQDALTDIDAALKLEPNSWEAQSVRGDVEACLGNSSAAEAAYTAAIALQELPSLYWSRGHFRFLQKNYEGAIDDFTREEKQTPDNYYVRLWLELTRLRAGTLDAKTAAKDIGYSDTRDWPGALLDLYAGNKTPERALAAVNDQRGSIKAKQCEADFFVGAWWLGHGNAASAKPLLEKAALDCPPYSVAARDAQRELKALN